MRIPETPPGQKVFTYHVTPPWNHLDALGHINNVRYFEYCEQARIDWFDQIGLSISKLSKSSTGPILINASCTYVQQGFYPCQLEVHLFAGDPGRTSFMTWCEIRGVDQTLYASNSSKIVWVNYRKGKSVPLPNIIRQVLTDCG